MILRTKALAALLGAVLLIGVGTGAAYGAGEADVAACDTQPITLYFFWGGGVSPLQT